MCTRILHLSISRASERRLPRGRVELRGTSWMSDCFPTVVWDIADRPEWSVRLVGRHLAWQAPGPRVAAASLD